MIKNYTSSQPVGRSVELIEWMLAKRGASQILKTYSNSGFPTGISFLIKIKSGDVMFRLPSRVDQCTKVMVDNMPPRSRVKPDRVKTVKEQAARTAWKILQDWCEAQMAMIDLAQVDMCEVFLPYMLTPSDTTVYEHIKTNGVKMLMEGNK